MLNAYPRQLQQPNSYPDSGKSPMLTAAFPSMHYCVNDIEKSLMTRIILLYSYIKLLDKKLSAGSIHIAALTSSPRTLNNFLFINYFYRIVK